MLFLKSKNKISAEENEQKDTFVATIVHDLKNPLIAHLRILEKIIKKSDNEIIKEHCALMLTSTRILLDMVLSITNTYKYNKGKITYNFQEVNLPDMVEEISKELTMLTEKENQINITSEMFGNIIIGDKLHIRRVISNLIANAIRHKKENSQINIELSSDGKNCTLKVTNTGNYITPNIQKELFKKYVSKSSAFNSSGTGLGLYLSQEIIKAHHGKMFLYSTPDGINTFGFTIPTHLPEKKPQLKNETLIIQ